MPKSSFPDREIIFHAVVKFFNFRVRERSARAPIIAASGSRKEIRIGANSLNQTARFPFGTYDYFKTEIPSSAPRDVTAKKTRMTSR